MDSDFLDYVLLNSGFGERSRKQLKCFLSSISFAVVIYGKGNGWISASRDLMQGDLLSRILVVLAVNLLTRMLLRASDVGLIKGEIKR